MTLLMRWSGLRIRDAVTLERHRLNGDSLLLYQAKTGTPVYVPIPPNVVDALENIPPGPKPNPRYFFWSGDGEPIRRRSLYVRVEHPTPAREAEIIASRTPDADREVSSGDGRHSIYTLTISIYIILFKILEKRTKEKIYR